MLVLPEPLLPISNTCETIEANLSQFNCDLEFRIFRENNVRTNLFLHVHFVRYWFDVMNISMSIIMINNNDSDVDDDDNRDHYIQKNEQLYSSNCWNRIFTGRLAQHTRTTLSSLSIFVFVFIVVLFFLSYIFYSSISMLSAFFSYTPSSQLNLFVFSFLVFMKRIWQWNDTIVICGAWVCTRECTNHGVNGRIVLSFWASFTIDEFEWMGVGCV